MTATESPQLSAEHREVLERLKAWIDRDVARALARTGQVKLEVNVKGRDVKANVTGFYQLN